MTLQANIIIHLDFLVSNRLGIGLYESPNLFPILSHFSANIYFHSLAGSISNFLGSWFISLDVPHLQCVTSNDDTFGLMISTPETPHT